MDTLARPAPRAGRVHGARVMMVMVTLLLAACGGDGSAPVVADHPWLHPPTAQDDKAVVLPPFLVYRVPTERVEEAVAELATEPYVQISPSLASHFAGTDVQVPAELRPFLIRGLTAGKSDIAVVQSLHGLWVKVAGSELAHPQYQPLVVLLDPTPLDIFVTLEARPPAPP